MLGQVESEVQSDFFCLDVSSFSLKHGKYISIEPTVPPRCSATCRQMECTGCGLKKLLLSKSVKSQLKQEHLNL